MVEGLRRDDDGSEYGDGESDSGGGVEQWTVAEEVKEETDIEEEMAVEDVKAEAEEALAVKVEMVKRWRRRWWWCECGSQCGDGEGDFSRDGRSSDSWDTGGSVDNAIIESSLPPGHYPFRSMRQSGRVVMGGNSVDMDDRDPNNLNAHLQVLWDDVIGEPEGVRSPDCVWRLSAGCFRHTRNCCYVGLSVLLAPIFALCLGCTFACLAFEHIWCVAPCLRICKISCATTRTCMQTCTGAIVTPCTEALGYFWYNFRIKLQKLPDAVTDRKEDLLVV